MALPARQRTILTGAPAPLRLVLDTNVWLDWLVFADPGVRPIQAALQRRAVAIVIDEDCEHELQRVLAYPAFALDSALQAACLARLRSCTDYFTDTAIPPHPDLPACRDRDDQKFLVLASKAGAAWLLTRDKALLSVNRRKLQSAGVRVATPADFALSPDGARAEPLPALAR